MKSNYLKKVSLAALSLAMVGCSSSGGTAASGSASGSASASTGDSALATEFSYSIGGETQYLDPATNGDSVTALVTNQIWYPLFYIGDGGNMYNAACTSMDVSDDGLTYTLHLDENAKWSDGEPLEAEDYVYSIKRSIGLGFDNAGYLNFITDYVKNAEAHVGGDVADMDDVGVKAVDQFTLEITLESVCPFYEGLLANGVYTAVREDFAAEHSSEWSYEPGYPTTGAFVPTAIDTAAEIVMAKNENFSHADEVSLETITGKVIEDMDAAQVAYLNGEIDFVSNVNSDAVNSLADDPGLVISDSVVNYYININCFGDVEAFHDRDVRRAMQIGIDRSTFVTAMDAPGVYYELYGLVPVGIPGTGGEDFRTQQDKEDALIYYDLEEAQEIMKSKGYSEDNMLEVEYYYNQNTMHDTIAAVLKEELKNIYIDVTLKTGELRTFFQDRSDGYYDLARNAFSADYMDPMNYLELGATYNKATTITWGDETYDAMLKESIQLTGDERMEKLHDAEEYLIRDMAYTLPLIGYKSVYLCREGVDGIIYNPQGCEYFWYVTAPAK